MEAGEKRKVCASCHQELGLTAYYRHLRDLVGSECPGKRLSNDEENCPSTSSDSSLEMLVSEAEDSSLTFSSEGSHITDSSFSLDSNGDCVVLDNTVNYDNASLNEGSDDSNFSISTYSSSESGEEVWDIQLSSSGESDIECSDEGQKEAKSLLHVLSIFLNFFHLTFRVSERAMLTLLCFIHTLFQYISLVIGKHETIDSLISLFSKSLYGIRKSIKPNYGLTEFVVCPKVTVFTLFLSVL